MGLGSNLGDRLENLRQARRSVCSWDGVSEAAASSLYETEPVGVTPEFRARAFLNAVLIVRCRLPLRELIDRLHGLEADMGRRRSSDRNAPRPIDLDILYAGAQSIDDPLLRVPHPRWSERRFVVQPLADVRPALVLPGDARTVAAVLASLPDVPRATPLGIDW